MAAVGDGACAASTALEVRTSPSARRTAVAERLLVCSGAAVAAIAAANCTAFIEMVRVARDLVLDSEER